MADVNPSILLVTWAGGEVGSGDILSSALALALALRHPLPRSLSLARPPHSPPPSRPRPLVPFLLSRRVIAHGEERRAPHRANTNTFHHLFIGRNTIGDDAAAAMTVCDWFAGAYQARILVHRRGDDIQQDLNRHGRG